MVMGIGDWRFVIGRWKDEEFFDPKSQITNHKSQIVD